MRLCTTCKKNLPNDSFSKQGDKFRSKCKDCHNTYVREVWYPKNRQKQIRSSKTWTKNNKAKALAGRYKVPLNQVEDVIHIDSCQICGRTERLVLDHCHDTLTVRGILCQWCNTGLGQFRNSPELLIKASLYLTTLYSETV